MGLLALGTPLDWPDARQLADRVRTLGIQQFLNLWNRLEHRVGDQLLWGEEIEYMVVNLDDSASQARLSLRQLDILNDLRANVPVILPSMIELSPTFHQEYGRFMIESTPGAPYGPSLEDCLKVEANMHYRWYSRQLIEAQLLEHEVVVTLTSFPRLGAAGGSTLPFYPPCGPVAQSLYLPDQIINEHVRFPTLTSNIRQRRGSKVKILVPIYEDVMTVRPFRDPTIPDKSPEVNLISKPKMSSETSCEHLEKHPASNSKISIPDVPDNFIYLDAMGFGMGCCCLQITFQACSVGEARAVYDALVPVAPIMMALSAASPIYKGFLSDVDCRWNIISGAVDDRTDAERQSSPEANTRFIPKSRYDSVSLYISDSHLHLPEYDDVVAPVDESIERELISKGVDPVMARHVAHLFIRDPLVIFSETLENLHEASTDHFENIQSTNWQSVRFKPPPSSTSSIGWRVEFRSMEVQITDFENAAYSIFIVLLTRAILSFGLNFYLPISKVDENMRRAQKRDSCGGMFYFRRRVLPQPMQISDRPADECSSEAPPSTNDNRDPEFDQMTMDEIMHGKKAFGFPGLMGLVKAYLISLDVNLEVKQRIDKYLDLISQRASGKLVTTATHLRNFVKNHPSYNNDSIVTDEINYDLVRHINDVEKARLAVPNLLGSDYAPIFNH